MAGFLSCPVYPLTCDRKGLILLLLVLINCMW